jgi:hypothetical protein
MMMKCTLLLGLLLPSITTSDASVDKVKDETKLSPEDYMFWNRVLQNDLSIPTAPPMKQGTTAPVPLPVTPPVSPPLKAPITPPVPPPPVPVPVPPPVKAPTSPPMKQATTTPIQRPLTPPVAPPVPIPVKKPTTPPFTPPKPVPVKAPVAIPVTPPMIAPVPCDIDVAIECVTSTDLPCNEIQPPNPVCSVGSDIAAVTFGYSGNACNPTGNSQGGEAFCEDFEAIDKAVPVTILCRDAINTATGLVVKPPTVPLGGVFTVTAPTGSLPAKIDCILLNAAKTQLQQTVVDTSGDVSLNLTDEFGAFTLLACGDDNVVGGMQSCLETLSYTIAIDNVGPVPMVVNVADFIFDGVTTSFLQDFDTNILPGAASTVETRQTIDLCMSAEYCAEVNVEASPPNGDKCQDSDQYCFQISPLPPTPVAAPIAPPVPVSVPVAPLPAPSPIAPVPVPMAVPVPVPVAPLPVPVPAAPLPVPAPAAPLPVYVPVIPTAPTPVAIIAPVCINGKGSGKGDCGTGSMSGSMSPSSMSSGSMSSVIEPTSKSKRN